MNEADLRFRIWCAMGLVVSVLGMVGVFVLSHGIHEMEPWMQMHLTLSGFLFAGLCLLCFVLIAISPGSEDEISPQSQLD